MKRCLVITASCLPLGRSFDPVATLLSTRISRLAPRGSTCRCSAATLFSAEEEAALEEKGAGHLPPWEEIPLRETFDQLQRELTRPDFADHAWENSQDCLRSVVVELAGCVAPFSEHPCLPLQHAAALLLVGRLSERARGARPAEEGAPVDLYSSLKYSTKKNGVARAAADVARGVIPRFESSYERLVVVRGVERCVAEFGLVWSTARLLEASAAPEIKRDFLFHLRAVLEHAPARDRHEAVLVLCRGLFTPGHNKEASRVHDNVHGCALRREEAGYPLEDAFAELRRGAVDGLSPTGLRAARQAFPFLEMLARWAWRCKTSAEDENGTRRTSVTKSFGKKSKKKRDSEAVAAVAVAAESAATAAAESEERAIVNGEEAGARAAGVGSGGRSPAGEQDGTGGFGASRSRQDTGVATLLVELARADPSGDTIRSMQRWACDAVLPEEVS